MSRALDDLCPSLKGNAMAVCARMVERGRPFLIVDTLRTKTEHTANLNRGTSWTQLSKHLPNTECPMCNDLPNSFGGKGLSHAIDFAPYEVFLLHGTDKLNWDAADPFWSILGDLAEDRGLRWGGRWRTPDLGHVEVVT